MRNVRVIGILYEVTVQGLWVGSGVVHNDFGVDASSLFYLKVRPGVNVSGAGHDHGGNNAPARSERGALDPARLRSGGRDPIRARGGVGDAKREVVTFEQIDPLFAISFKDIANPVVLSALKVTGYSNYLHPLPGGYLIGVGKEAVPSSTGNFAWYLGMKLSLFRVFENGTSTQVSKYLIGDRGTESPVLNDHLAFTFDSSRNITVIPVMLAKVSGNQTYGPSSPPPYGDIVWQGVYVFKVTGAGFTLLGRVSQYPPGKSYGDSPVNNLQIDRSVIIGDYLYTVSQGEVMVSSLSSFSTVATVLLSGR